MFYCDVILPDVSQVVDRLGEVLGVDQPLSLLEDTRLATTASDLEQPNPVDSSTPATTSSSLLTQIARLQEEVSTGIKEMRKGEQI